MNDIDLFNQFGGQIRRVLDIETGEWWFSIVDVVGVLTDSSNPRRYWSNVRGRDPELKELSPNWGQLKMEASDGKMYNTSCANIEGMLRIIQSIPSPKAEPFKRWLAQVARERIEETADPLKALNRAHDLYRQRGYSKAWIAKRLKHKEVRETLIAEWANRELTEE